MFGNMVDGIATTTKEGLGMAKLYRVVLSRGYHNADNITVKVPYSKAMDGVTNDREIIDCLNNVISDGQRKRLEQHFCGIQGCTCGSWTRATVEVFKPTNI
jgi:hypothetical protein